MPTFCLYCGSKIPDEAVFCNNCGRRQTGATNTLGTGSTTQPSSGVFVDTEQRFTPSRPLVQETPPVSSFPPTPPVQSYSSPLSNVPAGGGMPGSFRPSVSSPSISTSRPSIGYIVAVLGGIVALLAFFFMPVFSYGYFSFTGQQLASQATQTSQSSSQLNGFVFLWLAPAVAGLVVLIAGWQAIRRSSGQATGSKAAAVWLIVLAVPTLLVLFGRYIYDSQPIVNSGSQFSSGPSVASFYGAGFWVFVVSMIAVVIGGIVQAGTE